MFVYRIHYQLRKSIKLWTKTNVFGGEMLPQTFVTLGKQIPYVFWGVNVYVVYLSVKSEARLAFSDFTGSEQQHGGHYEE